MGLACSIFGLSACPLGEPMAEIGEDTGETTGDDDGDDDGPADEGEIAPDLGGGEDEGEGDGDGDDGGDGDGDDGGDCEVPESTPEDQATVEHIVFVNISTTPIYIVPDPCVESLYAHTQVEGIEVADETLGSCEQALLGECGECNGAEYLVAPVRIDSGAMFDWTFDGYVYESVPLDESCPSCGENQSCDRGYPVDVGDRIRLQIHTAGYCGPEGSTACSCPEGTDACQLLDFQELEAGTFSELALFTFEFDLLGGSTTVALSN